MRKTGHLDLEAVEMLVRSAMHHAGATALTELLRFPVPDQRTIPCSCGQQARYRELRPKTVLTVVGTVEASRPYYGACKLWWGRMQRSIRAASR